MNKNIFKSSKRTKLFTLISVLALVVLIAINLLLSIFTGSNVLFGDMTYTGLYSVSAAMRTECDYIFSRVADGEKVKITFCTDPDYLIKSQTTRHPYVLAKRLESMYPDDVEIEIVNAQYNPTALDEYRTTSFTEIASSDIIVSYSGRYRILSAERFWWSGNDSNSYFNGEQRLASLIRSVTSVDHPAAYFVIDHGESYYDESDPDSEMSLGLYEFYSLLLARGFKVKTLELAKVDEIPDDCAILIINDPKEDFMYEADKLSDSTYVTDLEKLDRFLLDRQNALIVNKSYDVSLPNLEGFLRNWGIAFSDTLVKDEKNSLSDSENPFTALITDYNTDEDSYGYAIYGALASLTSAPPTIIENSGSISCAFPETSGNSVAEQGSRESNRTYVSFLTSSENSKPYSKNDATGEYEDPAKTDTGAETLAALTVRTWLNPDSEEYEYSYLFCSATGELFDNKYLENDAYANYDVLAALIENISRIDDNADYNLGGSSLNSASIGGKKVFKSQLYTEPTTVYSNQEDADGRLTIIKKVRGVYTADTVIITAVAVVPVVALLVLGVYVHIKRRYL